MLGHVAKCWAAATLIFSGYFVRFLYTSFNESRLFLFSQTSKGAAALCSGLGNNNSNVFSEEYIISMGVVGILNKNKQTQFFILFYAFLFNQ